MRPFDYSSPNSTSEVITQLDSATRPYAGGTDLLTRMKQDITTPQHLVDIKNTDLSADIEETENGLTLGALVTLTDIEMNPLLKEKYTLLHEGAALAATPQLRNRATLAGNLLQRPRCWYYRNSHIDCWLKGGEGCPAKGGQNQHHALFGESPCVAVHPSDLASCLTALNASVTLRGPNGERDLPLTELYQLPEDGRRQETVIKDNELILSITVPKLSEGAVSTYLKAMDRKVWAFALVGLAAVLKIEGSKISDARLTLSGVANIPWRLSKADEELVGKEPSKELFAKVAETALANAAPLEQNAYKVPLAKRLIKRALSDLAGLET